MSTTPTQFNQEFTPQKMLLSADDYQRMGAAGIFSDKPRVELIDGQIYTMSPISPDHNSHVDKASEYFIINLYGKAKVRAQGSVRTDEHSEPKPDVTILHFKENFYNDEQPSPEDIHLIVEIAVFTLQIDRTVKLKKYASVGIPEYWIVVPEKKIVEVYRKPDDSTYLEKSTYTKDDEWVFEEFNLSVKGSDLLI